MKNWLIGKYYRWKYRIRRRLRLESPVVWGQGEDMYFAMSRRFADLSPLARIAKRLDPSLKTVSDFDGDERRNYSNEKPVNWTGKEGD